MLTPPDDVGYYGDNVTIAPAHPMWIEDFKGSSKEEAMFDVEALASRLPPELVAWCRAHGIKHCVMQLKHQANGDCIYLGDHGCTIYDNRPRVCREFDCRLTFATTSREQRRTMIKDGGMPKEVFRAGRDRLHTLQR